MKTANPDKAEEKLLVKRSGGGTVSVLLVHPSTYAVGMSSLGYQVVWRVLNSIPGVWVDRAFASENPGKRPVAMDSGGYADDFDVVAYSLSFEPDIVNVVRFLSDAGIPVDSRKRHAADPVVLGGGIAVTLNPEPYADFTDIFLIGEAEEALPLLMERLMSHRDASRTRLLAEAAQVDGIYVPRFHKVEYAEGIGILSRDPTRDDAPEKVRRAMVADIDAHPAHSVFVAPSSAFGDMGLIEVTRGCARGCRFCAAGHITRPPRYRSLKSLKEQIDFLAGYFDCLGLVASTVTDHPDFKKLLGHIEKKGLDVSFASLSADGLSRKLLEAASKRSKTLTIAPETGSERLRRTLNKTLTNEQVVDAAFYAAQYNIKRLKLYFMVGLPNETGEDVAAVGALVKAVSEATRKAKKNVEVVASLAPFVPKAHTPFGLHPMEDPKVIETRMIEIGGLVRKVSGATVRAEPVWESVFQGLLSRGDRRVGKLIRNAVEAGSVKRALKKMPQWASETLYARRAVDDARPWDFIDDRIGNDCLMAEYHQGLLEHITKPCKPPRCSRCEACGTKK